MSGDIKLAFDRMAVKDATIRREGLPDPAKIAGSGIKTKEALAWLATETPTEPCFDLVIDDPALRDGAEEQERGEKRARINQMRRRFVGRSRKGREDFDTARNYRDQDRER